MRDGRTAGSAFTGTVDPANEKTTVIELANLDPSAIVFLAKDLVSQSDATSRFHADITYEVNTNTIQSIYVLQDGLTVEAIDAEGNSAYFSPRMGRELRLPSQPISLRLSGFEPGDAC